MLPSPADWARAGGTIHRSRVLACSGARKAKVLRRSARRPRRAPEHRREPGNDRRTSTVEHRPAVSLRSRWSSRTSARIDRGSWARCQRHSSRPARSTPSFGCGGALSLDRVGGRTELVRGDVCQGGGLPGGVGGMPWRSAEVPGRAVRVAGRRTGLGHLDRAARPCPAELDRPPRAFVARTRPLEMLQHVLRAQGGPQRQELVIRIGQGSTPADRHETRVALLRKDHVSTVPTGLSASDPP